MRDGAMGQWVMSYIAWTPLEASGAGERLCLAYDILYAARSVDTQGALFTEEWTHHTH